MDKKHLNRFIRNKKVVWYGPHACVKCGGVIVKSSNQDGNVTLDAPHGHHYPNHKWEEHRCVVPEVLVSPAPTTAAENPTH